MRGRAASVGPLTYRFSIDGSGDVRSASLVRSSGFSELDQEVVSLFWKWRYGPRPVIRQQSLNTAFQEAKRHSPAVAQTVGFGLGKSKIPYLSMGVD
jgi:TonB family protein